MYPTQITEDATESTPLYLKDWRARARDFVLVVTSKANGKRRLFQTAEHSNSVEDGKYIESKFTESTKKNTKVHGKCKAY
jgi:hypothetical protein